MACLMPFAAWIAFRGVEWGRKRMLRPLSLSVGLLVLFGAIGFVTYEDLPAESGLADQYFFVAQRYVEQGRFEAAAEGFERGTRESWVDPNSAELQRWRALERAHPGAAQPLQQRIRELIGRTTVVR